jgi:hypothetical protein
MKKATPRAVCIMKDLHFLLVYFVIFLKKLCSHPCLLQHYSQ